MAELQTWVGDQVLNLLGASDSALVSYFTTLATKSKSPASLHASLVANGLPENGAAQRFSQELYSRVPRAGSGASKSGSGAAVGAAARDRKQREDRLQEEQRKKELGKQKFSLMMDEPDEPPAGSSSREGKAAKGKGKEKDKSSARKRTTENDWDEEEPSKKRRSDGSPRHTGEEADGDSDEEREETPAEYAARKEAERLRDLQERDEFDKRMKAKDKDKSNNRKVVEDSTLTAEQRARKLLQDDAEKAAAAMPNLRDYSRQEYLKKREQQRIDLLRLEVQDFERDTRGQRLTKAEMQELNSKKEILRLTEERLRIDDGFDGYMMPEDYLTEKGKLDSKRKKEVLYKRYEDNKRERDREQFVTDLER